MHLSRVVSDLSMRGDKPFFANFFLVSCLGFGSCLFWTARGLRPGLICGLRPEKRSTHPFPLAGTPVLWVSTLQSRTCKLSPSASFSGTEFECEQRTLGAHAAARAPFFHTPGRARTDDPEDEEGWGSSDGGASSMGNVEETENHAGSDIRAGSR